MPRRAAENEKNLFPVDLRELAAKIGFDWWTAKKLYDDGYLSFDPEIGKTSSATQESEFIFLGRLVSAGCEPRMLKKLLSTLEKPYCYDLDTMYYDWSDQCWKDHDLPFEAADNGISALAYDQELNSLLELKSKILDEISQLTDEDDISGDVYNIKPEQDTIIDATRRMLWKIAASNLINAGPKAIVIGKLFKVFQDLPKVTKNESLRLSLVGPRRRFGDHEIYHFWEILLEEDGCLKVSSGGHFHRPETGGDSFSSMKWEVSPGYEPEWEDHSNYLRIVDDADTFENEVRDMDLESGIYKLSVEDITVEEYAENEAEDQDEFSCEEQDNGETQSLTVIPVSQADQRLAAQIDHNEVSMYEEQYSYGAEACDFCRQPLRKGGLYVDGRVRNDLIWANMCSQCFEKKGEGIGRGVGQIYAIQPNGEWRLVAGFEK